MPESCTLYCRIRSGDTVSFRKRLSLIDPVEVQALDETPWPAINCLTKSGSVRISRMVFRERADDFSKLVARTMVFFERRQESNPQGAAAVLAHLEATQAVLGIVADPAFDDIPRLPELIAFITVEFDALIFNGHDMLNANGDVIA
jgi:hypothetical protein